MGGKLNLYNLGDRGVHLVETPVHSPDGSFTAAQNAAVSQDQGEHGIRKRAGLAKLTTDALGGAVLSVASMPFADPFEELAITGTALYYNTATDGTDYSSKTTTGALGDWNPVADITKWPDHGVDGPDGFNYPRGGAISTNGVLYYYSLRAPDAGLVSWDGTTRTQLATVTLAANEAVRGLCMAAGTIYVLVGNSVAGTGKIHRYTGSAFENVGATISHDPTCITSAMGRLWVGTYSNRIYSWSIDSGVSTVELTATPSSSATVFYSDIVHFKGVLYAGAGSVHESPMAVDWKLVKRAASGSWSDITISAQGDYFALAVFNGALYIARSKRGSFAGCEIYSYNGTSSTLDLDVTSVFTDADLIQTLIVFNGHLYAQVWDITGNGGVIRRTTAGVWSKVVEETSISQEFPTGPMGFY